MPKYYPINEEAAKRVKDMNSFSDYQPGSATAGYRRSTFMLISGRVIKS